MYASEETLEILNQGIDKGYGINRVRNILDLSNVVVFGDGINDIPMFNVSNKSFAVNNSNDILKMMATDVINSCNEDAVATRIGTIVFRGFIASCQRFVNAD